MSVHHAEPNMKNTSVRQSLLSELQGHLSVDLFAGATTARRAVDEVLFVAGDAGNGCYRVVRSTGQCNTACSLSAGVWKPKVFRGR